MGDDDTVAAGLRSAAAPVREASGRVVAAVNVAVSSSDWSSPRLVRELRPPLVRTCAEISQLLGYAG
ncbi:IclR family transcriptional regulator C-terminal domain-containing protein [Cryptosporangium sp. NPDC051539]|uniref:IclR family transcriptional regulator domain-containing protein n=1 Tax=Cryptosporangium sp. NPDC051539 TaxID=3363962 RepID=UPI00379B5C47